MCHWTKKQCYVGKGARGGIVELHPIQCNWLEFGKQTKGGGRWVNSVFVVLIFVHTPALQKLTNQ